MIFNLKNLVAVKYLGLLFWVTFENLLEKVAHNVVPVWWIIGKLQLKLA